NSLTKQPQNVDSPGRSGARMLLSHDKRYFIKTLVSEDVEQMHHLIKQYHQHIVECHASTLLPHYLGMYRITVNDVETYLCVMRNVFSPRLPIHKKYDLKGSTVDRCASDKEKDEAKINIGAEAKVALMDQLTKDVTFLSNAHLMDYSLIVGIHDCDRIDPEVNDPTQNNSESDEPVSGEEENGVEYEEHVPDIGGFAPTPPDSPQPNFQVPAFDGDIDSNFEKFGIKSAEEVYFLALIDILTKYGMKKRTALAAKTMKHGVGAEISTVHHDQYAKRFLEFIDKCIE
ncbi:PI42B-like protein, partial [Mya arenaria]